MRTGYLPGPDDFFVTHGVYGDKITKMLEEMKTFLEENPKEILIVDFMQFYSFTDSLHERFVNDVVLKNFKEMAYVQANLNEINISLKDFWDNGKQVIMRYTNSSMAGKYDELWPTEIIDSPWFNTASSEELINFLNGRFDALKSGKLNVFQALLSPQTSTIICSCSSSLEKRLTVPGNEDVKTWLETVTNNHKKGINIVACDFMVLTRLVDPVIKLNDLLL